MFRKIVFANEGSPAADRALLYVEHLARRYEAEVIVVHAFEVPSRYITTDVYEELHDSFQKAGWAVVDDATQELEKANIPTRGVVREGAPARTILEVAGEENASLIVLGTRGPSSAAELLLGSVSVEVLRFARCPVLAVP
ncbi:MAG TPA: universal stress protein [Anaerolineae bacterium]|nr:universal stress protein [Anaerolineae bacterium]